MLESRFSSSTMLVPGTTSSAGRFHHAQGQVHRFLNSLGGYTRSVNSYSAGATEVILPHVIGPQGSVAGNNVSFNTGAGIKYIEAFSD